MPDDLSSVAAHLVFDNSRSFGQQQQQVLSLAEDAAALRTGLHAADL
jgi:hypothetical protein